MRQKNCAKPSGHSWLQKIDLAAAVCVAMAGNIDSKYLTSSQNSLIVEKYSNKSAGSCMVVVFIANQNQVNIHVKIRQPDR